MRRHLPVWSRRSRRLGFINAASMPVVAATARQMLIDHARLAPGQTVLIHGTAGSVGAYAVQFARMVRARVIATASARDFDYIYGLDADEVIDSRASRFEDGLDPVDVAIDLVGGDVQRRSLSILKSGGILVSAVSKPDAEEARWLGARAEFILVDVTTAALERIAAMVDAGEIATSVGAVLPLAELRTAHEMMEGMRSRPRGKIVLKTG
ncbi:MAG TPA: NADP-dependent oxidoreductase [Methyloceanibacter sp.]|nr:NADP-dependent oxidoreductase [Methyloceanibacter sp.]